MNPSKSRKRKRSGVNSFSFSPPIAIGLAVLVFSIANKAPLPTVLKTEPIYSARVVELERLDMHPVVVARGAVKAERTWNAVAEVSGRVVEIHPKLQQGAFVGEGELLARIDPSSYELALVKSEAALAELKARETRTQTSLQTEKQSLRLAQKELVRQKGLRKKGTVSQKGVDDAERAVLNSRQSVQSLETELTLIPVQQQSLEANIAQAKLDLENTQLLAPYNMRIGPVSVEAFQYVSRGERLFEGDAVDTAEIELRLPTQEMRKLVLHLRDAEFSIRDAVDDLPEVFDLRVVVRIPGFEGDAGQLGRFVRTATVDEKSRTVGVVVAVDNPYDIEHVGVRPPLVSGLYTQVTLIGPVLEDQILIPQSAIRNGRVYVLDAEQRLQSRSVRTRFHQGDMSVIAIGLEGGEQLVVSDLVPVVEGMRIAPARDEALTRRIREATRVAEANRS